MCKKKTKEHFTIFDIYKQAEKISDIPDISKLESMYGRTTPDLRGNYDRVVIYPNSKLNYFFEYKGKKWKKKKRRDRL